MDSTLVVNRVTEMSEPITLEIIDSCKTFQFWKFTILMTNIHQMFDSMLIRLQRLQTSTVYEMTVLIYKNHLIELNFINLMI